MCFADTSSLFCGMVAWAMWHAYIYVVRSESQAVRCHAVAVIGSHGQWSARLTCRPRMQAGGRSAEVGCRTNMSSLALYRYRYRDSRAESVQDSALPQ